ncbi:MAG: gamma-carotene 1'-hydroxylase CruF [Pseudanabaena sp. ELA607]
MKRLMSSPWLALSLHLGSMVFGLLGLVFILPNTTFIESLSEVGLQIFAFGMQSGGAVYMIFGAIAAVIYGWHTLGLKRTLMFLLPAVGISLTSELLGTSTGFPFGAYSYLSGLGYKIADLVPFTIPLSWFYVGFCCVLLGSTVLRSGNSLAKRALMIGLGALMLTSWDFVLDPAMSQTPYPFWEWHQEGEFFGMPLQNFAGWMGTGATFMTVASVLWGKTQQPQLNRDQLVFPLVMYVANFLFALILSTNAGFYIPVALGIVLGALPAVILWFLAPKAETEVIIGTEKLSVVNSEPEKPEALSMR